MKAGCTPSGRCTRIPAHQSSRPRTVLHPAVQVKSKVTASPSASLVAGQIVCGEILTKDAHIGRLPRAGFAYEAVARSKCDWDFSFFEQIDL